MKNRYTYCKKIYIYLSKSPPFHHSFAPVPGWCQALCHSHRLPVLWPGSVQRDGPLHCGQCRERPSPWGTGGTTCNHLAIPGPGLWSLRGEHLCGRGLAGIHGITWLAWFFLKTFPMFIHFWGRECEVFFLRFSKSKDIKLKRRSRRLPWYCSRLHFFSIWFEVETRSENLWSNHPERPERLMDFCWFSGLHTLL